MAKQKITVVVSVNGRFREIRHWCAVALTATKRVCKMRPADTFREFKGCAKCSLRIRSVSLRGVQNAACGYVPCVLGVCKMRPAERSVCFRGVQNAAF